MAAQFVTSMLTDAVHDQIVAYNANMVTDSPMALAQEAFIVAARDKLIDVFETIESGDGRATEWLRANTVLVFETSYEVSFVLMRRALEVVVFCASYSPIGPSDAKRLIAAALEYAWANMSVLQMVVAVDSARAWAPRIKKIASYCLPWLAMAIGYKMTMRAINTEVQARLDTMHTESAAEQGESMLALRTQIQQLQLQLNSREQPSSSAGASKTSIEFNESPIDAIGSQMIGDAVEQILQFLAATQ